MFLGLLGVVIGRAFYYSELVNIAFSFKDFSKPYFRLGVQFTKEIYLDRQVEVFSLALFFVHLDIDFVQPLSEEDKEEMEKVKKLIDEHVAAESDDSSVQP